MTMAAVPFGILVTAEARTRDSREFAAIGRATEWLNSSRLTAANLAGKVVLVDFWTYTCIQLAAHASVRSGVVTEIQGPTRRARPAHARVYIRTHRGERSTGSAADEHRLPRR
jgi:hypothetical protein